MKIKEDGGMDAQQQKFELAIKEAFPNSPQYLNKNPDGTYRNTTTFGAWIGWRLATKAQAVPEGFVLVPKYHQQNIRDALVIACDVQEDEQRFEDSLNYVHKAMIEAQEPAND